MEQIIYLDPDDDIATVRERLARTQTDRVALVVPARSAMFRNLVTMRLLRRQADQLALNLTLISADGATRDLAHTAGVSARTSLDGTGRHETETGSREASRQWAGERGALPVERAGSRLAGVALLLLLALFVAGAAALFVPEATISLSPATQVVSQTLDVMASPDFKSVDVSKGQVPAKLAQATVEDSAQVDSTGRQQEPADKATGKVMFRNLSSDALKVPVGTVVRTSTGASVRFRTTAEATVETGSFAMIPIAAELPGSAGNVPAWAINQVEGALSFQVVVTNDTPTAGGAEKQAALVTAADRQRLQDTLTDKLKTASVETLTRNLTPGDYMSAASLAVKVEDKSFDREVGEVSKSVGLRMRITVSTLVVPGAGITKLAEGTIQKKIPAGSVLAPGSMQVKPPSNERADAGVVSFRVQAQVSTTVALDEAQIRRDVQGQPLDKALQLLSSKYSLAAEPQIELENAWFLERLPFFAFRIRVKTS